MASTYIKLPLESGGGGPTPGVDSFNGRTGVVVSQAGDYSAGIVSNTPAGNIAATTVQAAINELDSEKQAVITGAASTITTSNLTANRALQSNGSGKVDVSAITSTELGHLSGVTSAIQTQLNNKQNLDSTLTALAAYNTNGILTQTAPDTFVGRTITGSSSVSVTNGDGVSGNPTLALPTSGVTAGSYLNSNVTVNDRGVITSISNGVSADLDPDLSLEFKDDFTGGAVTSGSYGFTLSNSGTGANSTIVSTGIDNTIMALGVMSMNTGTTTTGRTSVSTGLVSFIAGTASFDGRSRLWLSDAGTVPEQFEFTFGFIDNTGATQQHVDGAYFRFLGNGVNTNWQIVTSAANVQTITTTSSPVLVNNAQIFQVIINNAGTLVQFYIDGILVGSHVTNIPSLGQFFGYGWKLLKTAGTSARLAFVDWGYLKINFSAPRG